MIIIILEDEAMKRQAINDIINREGPYNRESLSTYFRHSSYNK
jgi:hypothetical protein